MAFDFIKRGKAEAEEEQEAAASENGRGVASSNPAKARKFFEHAKTIHDTANYAYAMTLWLQGIRHDPMDVDALEKFLDSAGRFADTEKRAKGPTSEQKKDFGGRTPVERYLRALLEWGARPLDWGLGVKAMEAAAKIGANEPAYAIGSRTLGVAANDPKAKKDTFVAMMKLFQRIGGFDKAVIAGEIAVRRDPGDAKLMGEVKNMSAQATMTQGGYEQTGEEGGFRANVRDTSRQRELEEEERIVKTEDVAERAIRRALADYESRPTDNAAIEKLARLLRERGRPDDLKKAYRVLMEGFKTNQNYRFKMGAGDIRLLVERQKLRARRKGAADDPGDAEKQQALADAEKKYLEMEIDEFKERVANMPTDLKLKYELASRCAKSGQFEVAIENFQQATESPQLAPQARRGLAESFAQVGWLDESESTYREALSQHHSESDDIATELRYGLMRVLEQKAREHRDLPSSEEAFKLASSIAIKRIGYRDIRERRNSIQELVRELKGEAAGS